MCEYDETQSIGRRYRRQDEIGTPYCVTVDFESLEDQQVTVRERLDRTDETSDRRPRGPPSEPARHLSTSPSRPASRPYPGPETPPGPFAVTISAHSLRTDTRAAQAWPASVIQGGNRARRKDAS